MSQKRLTRANDLKRFSTVLKKAFPAGIKECEQNGNLFPWYFTVITKSLRGQEGADYPALEAALTTCMEKLDIKVPSYPLK